MIRDQTLLQSFSPPVYHHESPILRYRQLDFWASGINCKVTIKRGIFIDTFNIVEQKLIMNLLLEKIRRSEIKEF